MIHPAAANALKGAFELFLGRRDGLKRFDMSVDGFWHSFRAVLYVLPFSAINTAVEHRLLLADSIVQTGSDGAFLAARIVDFALDWITMPLLLALFARQLQITRSYAPYIVVRNWASVIMVIPQSLIALMIGTGVLSLEIGSVLSLGIVGVMLRYHYQIVGLTLGKSVPFKLGLVTVDVILSLVLGQVIDRLFGF
ncbi:hypothetical protein OSH11_16670 [Kaistia dalseonensis]|uniref:Uncharacterized protein n=1 Tax=Kaistia dalseonensis TaxID=410840 RepID=A0ABU0H9G3_9HYPH|nr:hypothetical protein [Kaistia dalseonensis]MCX5496343.1 hypothetical protein [Kaistia dalseonensis]MDQ0438963.1 hypothetical protein [Kaistia dalseonensis]